MSKERQLIAIAGGTCSGKTTLVDNVSAALGNQVSTVSFDEYFDWTQVPSSRENVDWESPDLYNYEILRNHLKKIREGKSVEFMPQSEKSKSKGLGLIHVEARSLFIVEGFVAWAKENVRDLYDLKVYIDLPMEEMLKRRLKRREDNSAWDTDEYINSYIIPGHKKYVQPQKDSADLILDGTLPQIVLLHKFLSCLGL